MLTNFSNSTKFPPCFDPGLYCAGNLYPANTGSAMTRLTILTLLLIGSPLSTARLVSGEYLSDQSVSLKNAYFNERLTPDLLRDKNEPELRFDAEIQPLLLVRGQQPTYDNGGGSGQFFDENPSIYPSDPNATMYGQPGMYGQTGMVDPFMNPQPMMAAPPVQVFPGVNGPQPYRYGWTLRAEFQYFAPEAVRFGGLNLGDAEVFGVNVEAQNAMPLGPGGWVFIHTPNFAWRQVNGPPVPVAVDGLFDFGWDLKLVTPAVGGWGAEIAFEPSVVTDFNASIDSSRSVQWDGRGALYWQWGPTWTWVGGIMYWDRVRDRILPYGGAIWRPNQIWEFRAMFPESQARVFMGTYGGWAHWLYARAEFHSESYGIQPLPFAPAIESEVQLDDWRATLGWQFDNGISAGFVEAGWIFDRKVRFGNPLGFGASVDSGFITRAGWRF
jgi:hypothetical protein